MNEIRLDLAELKYEPPEEVQEAVRESVSEINSYPSGSYDGLRKEFSDYLGVGNDQVVFSNGLDGMIDLITEIWGGSNFVPVPTFSQFSEASERKDQETLEVSMMQNGSYRLNTDKIDFDCDLIWLCSPNNPTGTVISQDVVKDVCRKSSGIVVVDECYAEFCDETAVDLVEQFGNLIVLRSFSKSFGLAGLRLGAAVSCQENIEKIDDCRRPFNVNLLAAEAGKAALRNREKYRKIREEVIDTGESFAEFLNSRGIDTGEVNGNFLLAEFQDESEARRYFEALEGLEVYVFPGWDEEFSGLEDRFLRFTIGTSGQMEEAEKRFKRSEEILEQENLR